MNKVSLILSIVMFFCFLECDRYIRNEQEVVCCKDWRLQYKDSIFMINFSNQLKVLRKGGGNIFFSRINDTQTCKRFICFGKDLFLINCLNDSLYIYHIENNTNQINPKIEIQNNKYFYSDKGCLYILDSSFNEIYNSWTFVKSLSDSSRLGLSGVDISYSFKKEKMMIISYRLLTDIDPIIKETVIDTLLLD